MFPFVNGDLVRFGQLSCEELFEFVREPCSEHDDVDLVVAQETPKIHVCRPYRGPDPIHNRGFGVQHSLPAFIHFGTGFEEVFLMGAPGVQGKA